MKILIVGNSVALRNRPHSANALNYGQLIEKELSRDDANCRVDNLAFTRATILDILRMKHSLINKFPDYYIFNIGVCDAATREIPLWYSNYINSASTSLLKNILKGIYLKLIQPRRRYFTLLRGKKAFISKNKFKKKYSELVDLLSKNTNAKFIFLSINHANERVEKELPGTSKNYIEYNNEIKDICNSFGSEYIDLDDLDSKIHYPDGTHFSQEGNRIVAERIIKILDKNNGRN